MLPVEWTSTMRPLQDRCDSTPLDDIRDMFISDLGQRLDDMFEEFDPTPLGTASLAQVHRAKLNGSGRLVAVKVFRCFFFLLFDFV
jgi:aarF domain-containing kinase